MKNLFFLLFLICSATIVAQQIPAHHYSILTKDYNDKNNPVAREYKRTGVLPAGKSAVSVSELLQRMGADELWVQMTPAAWHNRQVNGGIYMQHYEEMILDASGTIESAVTCSNFVPKYKFIYWDKKVAVQQDCYECITNVTVTVNGEVTQMLQNKSGQTVDTQGNEISVTYN